MTFIERMADARGHMEGKILAVLLAIALVFGFTNVNAFAELAQDLNGDLGADSPITQQLVQSAEGQLSPEYSTGVGIEPEPEPEPEIAASASTADEAVPAGVARVGLDMQHSYIVYKGQPVQLQANFIDLPLQQDFVFEALPDNGFENVEVKAVIDGVESVLEPEQDGTYKIAAQDVTSNLTIKTDAQRIAGAEDEEAVEPIEDEQPSDADEQQGEADDDEQQDGVDDDAAGEPAVVDVVDAADYTVNVGDEVTIVGSHYSTSWAAPSGPKWSIESGSEYATIHADGNSVTVTGVKPGTVTIMHTGYVNEGFIIPDYKAKSETFTVKVLPAAATKTVTFMGNGGTVDGEQSTTVKVDAGMTINSTYGAEMPTASKSKRLFVGWTTFKRNDNYYTGDNAGKLPGDLFTGDTVVTKNMTVYAYYTDSYRDYFEYNLAKSNESVEAGGNQQPDAEFYEAVTVDGLNKPVYNERTGKFVSQMTPAENLKDGVVIHVKPGYELVSISWRCNNRDGNGYNCANFKDGEAASVPIGATGDVYISYGMLQGLSHESTNTYTDKNILMLHIKKDDSSYSVKYVDNQFGSQISATLVDSSYLNGEYIKQIEGETGFTGAKNAPYVLAPITDQYKAAAAQLGYEFGGWKFTDTVEPKEGSFHASQCGSTDISIAGNRVYTAIWVPVSFTKTVIGDKAEYKAGDEVTFELKYKNNRDEAVDVAIVDTLPAGLTYKSDSAGATVDGQKVSKTFTGVASGAEISMTITATVDNDVTPGSTLKNTATANGIETFAEVKIADQTFTVTYTGGDHGTFEDQVYSGLAAGVETPGFEGTPAGDAGYRFVGWKPEVAATVSADATYVAQWAEEYHVIYKDPHNVMDNPVDNNSYITGEQATVLGSDAVHDSSGKHVLIGWTTMYKDPFIGKASHIINDYDTYMKVITEDPYYRAFDSKVTFEDSNITLYAIWGPKDIVKTFTVTYELDGGTTTSVETQFTGLRYGTVTPTIDEPTKDGYIFAGWKPAVAETVTADATYTAQWTPKTPITITAKSDSKVYDGTALTNNGWDLTAGTLAEGDKIESVVVAGSQTDVGSSDNTASGAVIMNNGVNVTDNYIITYGKGTLSVAKRNVTLTSATDSKVYDGTALTNATVTVGGEGFAAGEGATYDVTGSQTLAGSSENTFTYTLNENTKADNYNITIEFGTLTVTKIETPIVITAASAEKTYDGAALTDNGYTFTEGVLADGDTLTAVVEGSITDAGTAVNVVTSYKVMRGTTDVTDSYTFGKSIDGTLEVTPRPITITAASDSKVYNGEALTNEGYSLTAGTLAENETIDSVAINGSQTNVGSSPNIASSAIIKNGLGEETTGNYTISYEEGTLEVTPAPLTIKVDATKVYDNNTAVDASQISSAITAGVIPGDAVNITVDPTKLAYSDSDAHGPTSWAELLASSGAVTVDNTNYKVGTLTGDESIMPKPITIIAASDSKVYDGTPLVNSNWSLSSTTLLNTRDEIVSVTVTGSQTFVGTSDNVASDAVIMCGTKDVTGNYDITYEEGTLEVTQADIAITIAAASDSKVYDGTALTNDGWNLTAGKLATGDEITSVTVEGSQTSAGGSNNVPRDAIIMHDGTNVTENYNISYMDGTLQVTPRPITITAASDSKVYDGTALTNDGYSLTAGTLAENETIDSVAINGSQTNVGSSPNIASSAVIKNSLGEDTTANYIISYGEGTLTVTAPTPGPTPGPTPPTPTPTPEPTPTPAPTPEPEPLPAPLDTIVEIMENAAPTTQITDDGTPQAQHKVCWMHYYVILGMIITALYGAAVIGRRANNSRRLKNQDDDIMGKKDTEQGKNPAPIGSKATQPTMAKEA